jgi:hypothetical protein
MEIILVMVVLAVLLMMGGKDAADMRDTAINQAPQGRHETSERTHGTGADMTPPKPGRISSALKMATKSSAMVRTASVPSNRKRWAEPDRLSLESKTNNPRSPGHPSRGFRLSQLCVLFDFRFRWRSMQPFAVFPRVARFC